MFHCPWATIRTSCWKIFTLEPTLDFVKEQAKDDALPLSETRSARLLAIKGLCWDFFYLIGHWRGDVQSLVLKTWVADYVTLSRSLCLIRVQVQNLAM